MKKYIFTFAVIILFLASCGNKVTDFSQLQDRNGLFFLINSETPYTGKVVSKNNGKVLFEGNFKNGLREGEWAYYYPNGQKQTSGLYVDGLKDGQWLLWKDNGDVNSNEVYKLGTLLTNNASNQAAIEAAKQDSIKKEEDKNKGSFVNWNKLRGNRDKYYNGKPYTGGFIQYYHDNTKQTVGYYTNGFRSGKWTYYDKNGKVKKTVNY